jgi:ferredoxin
MPAMAIKRVWIEEWCIGCDASPQSCPEVFRIPPDSMLNEVIEGVDYSRYEEKIIDAAENCPVDAIRYE